MAILQNNIFMNKKEDKMKIIIIGGGASGLACAIKAKDNTNEVTILEKNARCGKKLLLTGNGRCNYFNEDFDVNYYHAKKKELLGDIITEKNKAEVLTFLDDIGLVPKIQKGYYYPRSNQAVSVLESLLNAAISCGVVIKTDVAVLNIRYEDKFYVETSDGVYEADKVVIATGSKAYPKTGSNGDGYNLVKPFHHLINPLPALTPLFTNLPYLRDWAGVRLDVKASLYVGNNLLQEESGEVQLTDNGISGIPIFNLSSVAIRELTNKKDVKVILNFLPFINDAKTYLDERSDKLPYLNISSFFDSLINYKLSNIILKKNKISYDSFYATLTSSQKNSLIDDLTSFEVPITGYADFNTAQVCSGGVSLDEINILTMESLNQKDLYIIGEMLDVDGVCGGYNLGFAWLSAILAAKSIRGYND